MLTFFSTGDASSAQDPENEETYGHWRRSGKMVVVDSLLKLWKSQGHKVLVFSQLKAMLDILEIFVRGRGYTYQRISWTTPNSSRQPFVNKFNEVSRNTYPLLSGERKCHVDWTAWFCWSSGCSKVCVCVCTVYFSCV